MAYGLTEYRQARFSSFSKGLNELATWPQYSCNEICMELPASTRFLCSTSLKKIVSSPLHIPNTQSHKRAIRRIVRMPNGSVYESPTNKYILIKIKCNRFFMYCILPFDVLLQIFNIISGYLT